MSLQIASLNSGSNGNCYYVGNHNEAILIDAGVSCKETEQRHYHYSQRAFHHQLSLSAPQRSFFALMEVVSGVVGVHIDNTCAHLDGGFGINAARVG